MKKEKKSSLLPVVLVILDGWGTAAASRANPMSLVETPNLDFFYKNFPSTQLVASGAKVGLHRGQVGNSEAGHMNIGAGRLVTQNAVHVSEAIKNGDFSKNLALIEAVTHTQLNYSNIHLMGLLSHDETAHSVAKHLYFLLKFLKARKCNRVYLHLFTDGRDAATHSATQFLKKLRAKFTNHEEIPTICGRYYAMDRIKKWSRIEKAYDAMVLGKGVISADPYAAIASAYTRGETDEFIMPTVIVYPEKEPTVINDNDSIIFFNLRSDRAREIAKPFVQKNFEKDNPGSFKRKKILKNIRFVALTDFGPGLSDMLVAFGNFIVDTPLPEVLKDVRQVYLSELEKFAHVTYFFNGGHARPENGETWKIVPSSGFDYAKHPYMSIRPITSLISKYLRDEQYDVIVANIANPDMIGHTGDMEAAKKTVAIVDECLGRLYRETSRAGGTLIITADHGNLEKMIDLKTGDVCTEHTTNPVPFIIVNTDVKHLRLKSGGTLADVAPTMLDLLHIKLPQEMTGISLIKKSR